MGFTGPLKAFGKSGKTKTAVNVKNPALQAHIDASLGDYSGVKQQGQNALADYVTKYLAGEGAATTRTGEEIGNIDRYFSGGVERDLEAMRGRRARALEDAADLGSRYALANVSRSRAMGEGGPSSYDRRLLMRAAGDARTSAAVDRAMAERADYDWLERTRMGLGGQRQQMANALAGYRLVPEGVRRQMFGQDMGFLGQLGELDRGNKFYGLEYKPSWTEKLAAGMDSDMATLTSLIGSVRGGGGGGAPAPTGGGAANYNFGGDGGGVSAPFSMSMSGLY